MSESEVTSNFRGLVTDGMKYLIVGFDNGTQDLSDYLQSGDTGKMFLITTQVVGGISRPVITAHTDDVMPSEIEGQRGMTELHKKSGFVLESSPVHEDDFSGTIEVSDTGMNRLYVGRPLSLVNPTQFLIRKNASGNTAEPPVCIVDTSIRKRLYQVCYTMTTTTDTLSSAEQVVDFSNYTSSQSTSIVPQSCYALITDGTSNEYIRVNYYDPVSGKADLTRGVFESTAQVWNGTFSICFFNRNHLDNYDNVTSTIASGINFYVVPHSKNGWLRSYRRLYDAYDYPNYGQVTKVRSPDHWGNPVLRQPHAVDHVLFLNEVYPDDVSSTMVGNYVQKSSVRYSNKVFSQPYDSDIGLWYDYCDTGETCGNCMGNTPDESDNCLVDPTAYDPDSESAPLTYGEDYKSEGANWNSRNRLQNHYIPIGLCVGAGFFVLIMFIAYVAMMGKFVAKVKENRYMMHDFTDEQKKVGGMTKGLAAMSALIFAGTAAWAIWSIIEGKKSDGKRFFPATNYNRSVYNPPPGYTFINAPNQENK